MADEHSHDDLVHDHDHIHVTHYLRQEEEPVHLTASHTHEHNHPAVSHRHARPPTRIPARSTSGRRTSTITPGLTSLRVEGQPSGPSWEAEAFSGAKPRGSRAFSVM
jgi:hypothetical protein